MANVIRAIPLSEAKKHPACFLYVWASDSFLSQIDSKYADIILNKRYNESKLIRRSSEEEGITKDEYAQGVYDAFVEIYGMSPTRALYTLAEGGEVAGKNWKEGVFGVGSLSHTFKINKNLKVDPKTGVFLLNGEEVMGSSDRTVYGQGGVIQQRFYTDENNNTFCSRRHSNGKYYAESYSTEDGSTYTPLGIQTTGADGSSIWGNVFMNLINALLNWIVGLFGSKNNSEKITDENTFPNQTEDGFVYTEAGSGLLLLAAGGLLLAGGLAKSSKGKKKRR